MRQSKSNQQLAAELQSLQQENAALKQEILAKIPPEFLEAWAKLAAIVESSDDAIVSKTLEGIVVTWNKGAERIFGYKADEIIGKPINLIIPEDRQEEEPKILSQIRSGQRVDHFQTVRRAKDGRLIDVSVTISPVRDLTGRIIGASKIARDITREKEIQAELEAAKNAAEEASRAKDHFLSVLSHELRTPLTPVLGVVSYLERDKNLPAELRDQLAMLRRNVETEARLVDDLLDLTRISRGNIRLHREVMDVHEALRTAMTMMQGEIDNKGLELTTALRARNHHVWADAGRLQQIFLNLLSNAVKFTPNGGTVSIRTSGDAVAERMWIEIKDNGIGIEPEMHQRLFSAFEQTERSRRFGGLGLGLSIAKSLVDLHGGSISAASPGVGGGSTFTVELGTVQPQRAGAPMSAVNLPDVTRCRVLLVEDHSDTRKVMARLLESFGCTVTEASSVAEALSAAEQSEFDVLLSDIGLPDGSGNEIMSELRGRMDIKGIAVSGFGQDEDLKRSREAGFDTHLIKPVNLQTLRETIGKVTAA